MEEVQLRLLAKQSRNSLSTSDTDTETGQPRPLDSEGSPKSCIRLSIEIDVESRDGLLSLSKKQVVIRMILNWCCRGNNGWVTPNVEEERPPHHFGVVHADLNIHTRLPIYTLTLALTMIVSTPYTD